MVWKSYLQSSHVFTLWMLTHKRLPMHNRLDYLEDKRCTFCELIEETQKHVFFKCWPIKALWMKIKWWLQMDQETSTYQRMLKVFKQHFRGPTTWWRLDTLPCRPWFIWYGGQGIVVYLRVLVLMLSWYSGRYKYMCISHWTSSDPAIHQIWVANLG